MKSVMTDATRVKVAIFIFDERPKKPNRIKDLDQDRRTKIATSPSYVFDRGFDGALLSAWRDAIWARWCTQVDGLLWNKRDSHLMAKTEPRAHHVGSSEISD